MADQNVEMLLAHLKQTVIQFEAGYELMTKARAELHKVANNFKLQSIPLPETYVAKETNNETFEVAIWPNNTGSKLKASGLVTGTKYRVLLFDCDKEGVAMQGSVVPDDAPEGSDLKDISMGYANVKPNKAGNGYDLSIKFNQLDDWFNGPMESVVSDNPKAPRFRAVMHKSAGGGVKIANNPLLNVLQQLEVPQAAAPAPQSPESVHQPVAVAPVAPPSNAPDLSSFFNNQPAPDTVMEDIPLFDTPPAQPPAKPDPVADLFATTTKVPDMVFPSWLTE